MVSRAGVYPRPVRIDREEVRRIARLAHLHLDESEIPRLAEELGSILTYMESLERLGTEGVEPMFHPVESPTALRADAPVAGLGAEAATHETPSPGGRFLVPKVIG